MSVLVGERFACVKISGRANFNSSIDFKTLLSELRAKGYTYFVLELSECALMDSTFLGVLAGFGLKMMSPQNDGEDRQIELLNPKPGSPNCWRTWACCIYSSSLKGPWPRHPNVRR